MPLLILLAWALSVSVVAGVQGLPATTARVCDWSAKECTPRATFEGTVLEPGLCIRWNRAAGMLSYMKQLKDGYYDIFTAAEDWTNEKPLTVDHPQLPNKHQGVGEWHPGGRYMIFVAEKREHKGGSYPALPGFGGYSDIWMITTDAKRVWRLTDLPNDYAHGILLPRFSRDGSRVLWAERVKEPKLLSKMWGAGSYVIRVADFGETPEPHLKNIRQYQPGGDAFYEASDFSPDATELLFTSNFRTRDFWKNQIYSLDLTNGKTRELTSEGYNEHPSYTPDGAAIIFMSNHQADRLRGWYGTDWWVMNRDGSNKRRLTFMNKRNHPHSNGRPMWAGTLTWSADRTWFYGDVQTSLISQRGKVVKVRVDCDCR